MREQHTCKSVLSLRTFLIDGVLCTESKFEAQASKREHEEKEGLFPGDLTTVLTYSIVGDQLLIKYEATPTKTTPISLTNHAYFNLSAGAAHDRLVCRSAYRSLPHTAPTGGRGDGAPPVRGSVTVPARARHGGNGGHAHAADVHSRFQCGRRLRDRRPDWRHHPLRIAPSPSPPHQRDDATLSNLPACHLFDCRHPPMTHPHAPRLWSTTSPVGC